MVGSRISLVAVLGVAILLVGCANRASQNRAMPDSLRGVFPPPVAPAAGAISDRRPDAVITSRVWEGLTQAERDRLRLQYETQVLPPEAYGSIVDVQGVDRSTRGTTAGAHLGGAVAGAAYLDHGLRGGNYSAGGALAVTLLGAAIGSTMDRKPQARFQFRYTVRQGDGEMRYVDEHTATPFRHSPGLCVRVPGLTQVGQHVCEQTPESVRQRYLAMEWTPSAAVSAPVAAAVDQPAASATDGTPQSPAPVAPGQPVNPPAKPVL